MSHMKAIIAIFNASMPQGVVNVVFTFKNFGVEIYLVVLRDKIFFIIILHC